ncbi:hypothetical protein BG015_009405 [Linnemannia schmuckeri]|uniref:Uncharacterized protein n=1 Tax=Linnemannia schmuckeri TaxID=64567 RepID=A0A9P5RY25_9FUNG|nr:hypothetical protein BG015_009405 [Linnemannia schmuckeri]
MAARRIAYQPDEDLMCDAVTDFSDFPVLVEVVEMEEPAPAPALTSALALVPLTLPQTAQVQVQAIPPLASAEQPVAAAINAALTVVVSDGGSYH